MHVRAIPATRSNQVCLQLPWSSVDDQPFPHKARPQRRRVRRSQLGTEPLNFPIEEVAGAEESSSIAEEALEPFEEQVSSPPPQPIDEQVPIMPIPVQTPTTQASEAPSETGSTDLTTPSPAVTPQPTKFQQTPTPQPRSSRQVGPVIPAVPILPLSPKTSRHPHRDSVSVVSLTSSTPQLESSSEEARRSSTTSVPAPSDISPEVSAVIPKPASPPAPPKSWADLVRSKATPKPSNTVAPVSQLANALGPAKSETLSDVLNTIDVTATQNAAKIAFLKPRGLVNTGNMCYMNSVCMYFQDIKDKSLSVQVLQILVFCIPFYEFLERVGQRSAHSFKSDTPLIDAM